MIKKNQDLQKQLASKKKTKTTGLFYEKKIRSIVLRPQPSETSTYHTLYVRRVRHIGLFIELAGCARLSPYELFNF